jgi:hypothetical protein
VNYFSIVHVSLSTEENIHGTSHVCIAHDLLDQWHDECPNSFVMDGISKFRNRGIMELLIVVLTSIGYIFDYLNMP